MRLVLAAVAVASLAAVPAAHAAPQRVHWVQLQLAAEAGTVTCDTSGYPAAAYPCTFDFSDQYCLEWTFDDHTGLPGLPVLGSGDCSLRIRGPLSAVPTPVSAGHCTLQSAGQFHVTFDAGAFHTDLPATALGVQPVGVSAANTGLETSYLFDILGAGEGGVGDNVIGFQFPDIEPDCRTRAGGDPVTHTTTVGVRGTWIFVE